jgi:hypothetical protein
MKLYNINKILALSAAFVCFTNNAFATNNSGCDPGSSTPPTSTTCDTWEGALNYDLYTTENNVEIGTDFSTGGNINIDGVSIKVSAWSDTYGNNDDIVVEGQVAGPWTSNGEDGYGIKNQDELDYGDYENGGYSHAIDNLHGKTTDYDMVLFSFSEEVSLAGATFSWLNPKEDVDSQQITVVGLDSIQGLSGSTWANIASSNSVVNAGSFQIEKCDDVYLSDFTTTKTAQYWLVGAYNTAFGYVSDFSKKDDAFKLASIGFGKKKTPVEKPPTNVDAPSSFALLILGGGLMAWRRRKTQ